MSRHLQIATSNKPPPKKWCDWTLTSLWEHYAESKTLPFSAAAPCPSAKSSTDLILDQNAASLHFGYGSVLNFLIVLRCRILCFQSNCACNRVADVSFDLLSAWEFVNGFIYISFCNGSRNSILLAAFVLWVVQIGNWQTSFICRVPSRGYTIAIKLTLY